jgi:hypothetical protein
VLFVVIDRIAERRKKTVPSMQPLPAGGND